MPKKIYLYFYTDSVGFPRLRDQSPDITWPFLVKEMFERQGDCSVYLNMRGLGGGTIRQIEAILDRDVGYFRSQGPDTYSFAIFNVGIVDAAPRPFTYHLKMLARLPGIGKYVWHVVSKVLHASRKTLQTVHSFRLTSPGSFRRSFARMVERVQSVGLIAVSIDTPRTPLTLEERSPGLRDSIDLYNSLKHSVREAVHVPMDWVVEEHYLECGHHFNVAGHEQVAHRLYGIVRDMVHA